MKKHLRIITALLALVVLAVLCVAAFADDGTVTAAGAAGIAQMLPAHAPAIAAPAAMPAFPTLPGNHDPMTIVLWVVGVLIPWLGWAASEVMALIPGIKGNGILHAFLTGCGSVSGDADNGTVTVNVKELIAAVKGDTTSPTSPTGPTGA